MGTEFEETLMSWEIGNLSKRNKHEISLDPFSSGGCEWFVRVCPEGYCSDGHLSLGLHVAKSRKSLRLGWKRRAIYSFGLMNQSGKKLFESSGN
ncbi:unnamed protein product [Thlaspi arvense]|uniref:MATH domain-containing protein n=1 Tax=Thlaspi arvense TaxID=13288 RepID=A0AAU9REI2_THLAR|nr:unnamed protein product [Thlaspi arvense]